MPDQNPRPGENNGIAIALGNLSDGHLTSQTFTDVFNSSMEAFGRMRRTGADALLIDLAKVEWIDHLPLLALCMIVEQAAALDLQSLALRVPSIAERSAFLERWGFFSLLETKQVEILDAQEIESYKESSQSRVLPISSLGTLQSAGTVRDMLLRADSALREVLRKDACLTEADTAGLADLIVYELCKNVVEHSGEIGGFAIAHASIISPQQAQTRNRFAANWESAFYKTIEEEGVTEVVIGDAGIGIVQHLSAEAERYGIRLPSEVLKFAFEPYSTSKTDSDLHTRGLWCVKQKVRDFGGLLYVRSSSTNVTFKKLISGENAPSCNAGVACFWDFLNHPNKDEPEFVVDNSCFPGTQLQILLPQRNHSRPKTFVAFHLLEEDIIRSKPKVYSVPVKPPVGDVENQIRNLTSDEVLFINASKMEISWDRETVNELTEHICRAIISGQQKRIWILNPSARTLNLLRVSTAVKELWQQRAVIIPVVRVSDPSRPPELEHLFCDSALRINDAPGDTIRARQQLAQELATVMQEGMRSFADATANLDISERSWIEDAFSRNFSLARRIRKKGRSVLVSDLHITELASTAGMMLLPSDLGATVKNCLDVQGRAGSRWYRLTSGLYSKQYLDDRILYQVGPWLRHRINRWVEDRIRELQPSYVISYMELGNELLAHALRARPEAQPINLGGYVDLHSSATLLGIADIRPNSSIAFLVDISGSGKTIAKVAQLIEQQGSALHLVCLIDTVSDTDRDRQPALDRLYREQRVHSILSFPIAKRLEKPKHGPESEWPEVTIDPLSLVPIPEVLDSTKLLSDSEFWHMVASAGALSTTAISYKGQEFGSFIWLMSLFQESSCVQRILKHLITCCDGERPDLVLTPAATTEFLEDTLLHNKLASEFQDQLWLEGRSKNIEHEDSFRTQRVAIFCAAATSGSSIARLLKRCSTSRHVHICVFINRMSSDIASAFLRRQGVSFCAFQRLYSGSPALQQRSYRTAALRSLENYKRGCLSNRLLLFVEEQISHLQHSYTFLESPQELAASAEILAPKVDPHLFAGITGYDLSREGTRNALHGLVQSWEPQAPQWLRAVLEEAACRYEAANQGQDYQIYLIAVRKLYERAEKSQDVYETRILILETMVLERWQGQTPAETGTAREFATLLWNDFCDAIESNQMEFAAIALRTSVKLAPSVLLANLAKSIKLCALSRITELTLSLSLSKMRDDAAFTDLLVKSLNTAVGELNYGSAVNDLATIAFADLLKDLSLKQVSGKVVAMDWEDMTRALASRPPNAARTARAVIRILRRLAPDSNIAYYQQLPDGRFLLSDGWPPRKIARLSIASESSYAERLIAPNGFFFTPDIENDSNVIVRDLAKKLSPFLKSRNAETAAVLYAQLAAGRSFSSRDPRRILGLFRVVAQFRREDTSRLAEFQEETLLRVMAEASDLVGRPDANHVARVGAWQFEHAVGSLIGKTPSTSSKRHELLQALVDNMLVLLGADLGRVAIHEPGEGVWRSGPTSGDFWGHSDPIVFRDNDDSYATVRVSKTHKPEIIDDVHSAGVAHPPKNWCHGCVIIPLVREDGNCEAVITFWHHVKKWFSQYDSSLLESLAAIGGAWLQVVHAIGHEQEQKFAHRLAYGIGYALRTKSSLLANWLQRLKRNLPRGYEDSLAGMERAVKFFSRTGTVSARYIQLMEHGAPSGELCDIHAIVTEIIQLFSDTRVNFIKSPSPAIAFINADSLRDMLLELITNALEFCARDGGHISIQITTTADMLTLAIADNGAGIHPEFRPYLFTPYKCFPANRMGLGLAYSKLIANAYGGDIRECGEHGKGARFVVDLHTQKETL